MEKNSSKKGDIKISLLGLLIGISLIVAGVYGIVSNKIENQEYKNSTDIRTVNAVVEECRRKDEKNDADILIRSEYNTKVSFVVDGTTYKGRTYFVFGQNELKNSLPFQDKIRRGDEVSVEVYRTSKGSYKIKPDNDIITFTLLHGDSCWRSCCYNHGFGYFQTRICQKNLTDTFTEKRC